VETKPFQSDDGAAITLKIKRRNHLWWTREEETASREGERSKASAKIEIEIRYNQISESESDTSGTHTQAQNLSAKEKQWSSQEITQLLEIILGPDSKYHEEFNKNPMRIFKKAQHHIACFEIALTMTAGISCFFLDKLRNTEVVTAIVHLENWL